MVLAPCSQPPTMICKENRKVRKYLGRDGVTWQEQSSLAPLASRPPQAQPSATPGKQLHPWGGVSDGRVPARGRRHGDGYLHPPRTDISADAERSG